MKFRKSNSLQSLVMALLVQIVAWGGSLSAQDKPGPVNFSYSYATYAGDNGSSVLEISYTFAENGLTYTDSEGRLIVELYFYDESGAFLGNYTSSVPHTLAADTATSGLLAGIERFALDPGGYSLGLKLIDGEDPSRTDSTGFEFSVRPFKRDAFCVSDLELIKEMAPAGDGGESHPLARNGYIIVRNVSGVVTAPDYRVNSYLEIYNTHTLAYPNFSIAYLIADTAGRGLYRRDTLLEKSVTRTMFDLNSAVVNGLPSGVYILAARVYNGPRDVATDSVEVTRTFQVYNRRQDAIYAMNGRDVPAYADAIDLAYSGMKEEELDKEFKKASYIIADHQKQIWEGLSGVEAKARFLTRFWLILDDDPSTVENPFRDDYYDRIRQAKLQYSSTMYPEGWNSDRGRVLLQYGKPDGIDRHPSEHNRKPYEIWRYSSLGFAFVFVDRTQTGTYQLVHSTAPNEISFPEWEAEQAAIHKQLHGTEFNSVPGSTGSLFDN